MAKQQDNQDPTSEAGTTASARGLLSLVLGIKRRLIRSNDKKATENEALHQKNRQPALEASQFKCVHCAFRSLQFNEVFHLDGNHHNNKLSNLAGTCPLCHGYCHIGEPAKNGIPQGLFEGHFGSAAALIRVPDADAIPSRDMNHALRAIAMALTDPNEHDVAMKVFNLIANTDGTFKDMAQAFHTHRATDMAIALNGLTEDEYARRDKLLASVRVVYKPSLLKEWGEKWRSEQTALGDPAQWGRLMEKQMLEVFPTTSTEPAESRSDQETEDEGVGVESVSRYSDDDDGENDD